MLSLTTTPDGFYDSCGDSKRHVPLFRKVKRTVEDSQVRYKDTTFMHQLNPNADEVCGVR